MRVWMKYMCYFSQIMWSLVKRSGRWPNTASTWAQLNVGASVHRYKYKTFLSHVESKPSNHLKLFRICSLSQFTTKRHFLWREFNAEVGVARLWELAVRRNSDGELCQNWPLRQMNINSDLETGRTNPKAEVWYIYIYIWRVTWFFSSDFFPDVCGLTFRSISR